MDSIHVNLRNAATETEHQKKATLAKAAQEKKDALNAADTVYIMQYL